MTTVFMVQQLNHAQTALFGRPANVGVLDTYEEAEEFIRVALEREPMGLYQIIKVWGTERE